MKDGVEGLACECGDVLETQPISAAGYTLKLYEQIIRLAGSGAPVVVDLGSYTVIDNQHMLYKAIQSTNAILQNIENNTAMTAYWAEVAAYNASVGNTYGY